MACGGGRVQVIENKGCSRQVFGFNARSFVSLAFRKPPSHHPYSERSKEFKRETRFTSKCPANEIINKIEEAAKPLGFDVHKKNYKIFQVAPSIHMVEVQKAKGDTLEFHKFYKSLSTSLEDVVWKNDDDLQQMKPN
ncbi:hypothetical protein ACFE04_009181 [Oxalis oulophora]